MASESSIRVQRIGRAQLERRMLERGPHRPPDVARILHDAGAHQRRHVGVELLAPAEQLRQPGARQLVIGGEPVALEPGRTRLPERRGGSERHEQRDVGQHAAHHVDAVVGIGQLHVHVQAAQHVAVPDHLQVVHHRVVALLRRLLRPLPERRRMGAGGEDGEAVLGRDRRHRVAKEAQLGACLLHAGMGDRRHFDLRLQEFAVGCGRRSLPAPAPGRPAASRARPTSSRHRRENTPLQFRICMRGASGT